MNKDHAFLCDVPGFDTSYYFQVMQQIAQVEPYAQIAGGGAARSPKTPMTPSVGQISGGMARARITEMEDSD